MELVLRCHSVRNKADSKKIRSSQKSSSTLTLLPLTKTEEEFLFEYVRIMEPFTHALDILQNEETMSISCVLPTIQLLEDTMTEFSKDISIIHCQPLIFAVLHGLQKRFRRIFNNNFLKLASISDPNLKKYALLFSKLRFQA